jgi:hypothetical protein
MGEQMKIIFAFLATLILIACNAADTVSSTLPASCGAAKLSADSSHPLIDGRYKSNYATRPVGNVNVMFGEVKGDSMRIWTETANETPATPKTGAETFHVYTIGNGMISIGDYRSGYAPGDTARYTLHWMDNDWVLAWRSPLEQPTTGIREPVTPVLRGCAE